MPPSRRGRTRGDDLRPCSWRRGAKSAVCAPVCRGLGGGDPRLGAARQREDGAAALVDRRGRPPAANGLGAGRARRERRAALLAVGRRAAAGRGRRGRASCRSSRQRRSSTAKRLVRRLVSELEALDEPVVLVIDDLHELVSPDAQAQLELLLARRPRRLYVVLATRHDPSLGLHRLRLAGELTELRAVDLRLSADEARQLLEPRGSSCPPRRPPRSWRGPRAGPRACGSPRCRSPVTLTQSGSSPSSPAASGRWRTTCSPRSSSANPRRSGSSCCARRSWSGCAARSPTASPAASGSERTLLELEDANAFVVSIDPERSWFRYHQLFADLLLPRASAQRARDAIPKLHRAAAEWFAGHGYPIERSGTRRPRRTGGYAGRLIGRARLQPRARRQLRDHDGAARRRSRRTLGESRAGRVPGVRRGDPALARHRRRVHRAWPSATRRRCPRIADAASTRCSRPRRLTLARWRGDYGAASARGAGRCSSPSTPTPCRGRGGQRRAGRRAHEPRHRRALGRRRRRRRATPRRGPGARAAERAALRRRWAASAISPRRPDGIP